MRADQHRRTRPWLALGVVYVLWGSTYLANRYVIVSMPPLLVSGSRFLGDLLLGLVGPSGGSGGVSGNAWWGPPLVLLAGAGWATGTFLTSRMGVPMNPFALAAVQQLIGGTILVIAGAVFGERLHPAAVAPVSWWAWLYMALFVSLGAFSAYAYALATLPVSTVATYAYVNPVIAVLLGVVVAGERFSVLQLAGGAVVLVAVVMVLAAEGPAPGLRGSARPTRRAAGRPPPC